MERAGLKNVQYAQQQQVTCDPSKNYFGGGASNTNSSKVPITPEAQATVTRALGDTSDRGGGGQKMLTLK